MSSAYGLLLGWFARKNICPECTRGFKRVKKGWLIKQEHIEICSRCKGRGTWR